MIFIGIFNLLYGIINYKRKLLTDRSLPKRQNKSKTGTVWAVNYCVVSTIILFPRKWGRFTEFPETEDKVKYPFSGITCIVCAVRVGENLEIKEEKEKFPSRKIKKNKKTNN